MKRRITLAIVLSLLLVLLLPGNAVYATTTSFNSKTSDGNVYSSSTSYTTAHNASTGTVYDTGTDFGIGQYWNNPNYQVMRGMLLFDTSAIPAGATISSATLYFYGETDNSTTDFNITVCNGQPTYPHDGLQTADYALSNYPYYGGGSLSTSSFTTSGFNSISLTTSYVTKGGTTKLALISNRDISGTTPTGYEYVVIYSAESAHVPYLSVTYSAAVSPTASSSAATLVTDTTARLHGSIDNDGGDPANVQVRWGYGTTSQTSANFASYTTVTGWSGAYSTGSAPYADITSLTTGLTYYWRMQAKNSAGTVTTDPELSFTTESVPSITAHAASNIAISTARLNGTIDYDGAMPGTIQVRWGYGSTSETAGNFLSYDIVTAWGGAYSTGDNPYADINSLTSSHTYYFRFQAKNTIGTVTSGELNFATLSALNNPTNLIIIPSATSANITWAKGAGSTNTMVRYSLSAYPTTTAAGTQAYFGAASTYNLTGLLAGKTYYFSLWGESAGSYSASKTDGMITTSAGIAVVTPATPTGIARFFAAPDYTTMANLPFGLYDGINGVATSLGMPIANFWMVLFLGLAGAGGVGLYTTTRSASIGMITGLGILVFGWATQIVPFWIVLFDIIAVIVFLRIGTETQR
jgi:hypothetical protein